MRAVIRFTNCNGFHPGRIVNFAQGIGIQGVARNQDVDAKIGDAFEFALEVNGGFPIMNGGGGVLANAPDPPQFARRGGEDFGGVAEVFQQRTRPHRPDSFNQVQGN